MENFLENPNEATAQVLLETQLLDLTLKSCSSPEQALAVLKLLFQLNKFNIVSSVGLPTLLTLLSSPYLQVAILENLQCIEFPPQDYSSLISYLIFIFSSEPISPSRLSHLILVHKFGTTLSTPAYARRFADLLSSENTTLKIRALELVIDLANLYNFEIFETHGLIDTGLKMITCGDLLLQLVAIEAIIELGNSESGCRKLVSPQVQRVLISGFDEGSEVHFRNRLVLMAGKIAHFTGNFEMIGEKYWNSVMKMVESNDPAAIKNGLESLGFVASRQAGLDALLLHTSLLTELRSVQRSTNQNTKSSFYRFFSSFLTLLNETQVSLILSHIQPLPGMINELLNPFQDLHSDILKSFLVLTCYEAHALSLLSQEKFKEYLFKRPPHQVHEVSCLKFDLVRNLNTLELPQAVKAKCEKYLKAGIFAGPTDEDVELDVLN